MFQGGQVTYDSEFFDSDEEANYAQFTAIDKTMCPATSTQKKFNFKPYPPNKENLQSNRQNISAVPLSTIPSKSITENNSIKDTSSINETQSDSINVARILKEHGKIMRVILREVKLIRREQKEFQIKQTNSDSKLQPRLLEIPLQSAADFQKFEADIEADPVKEEALRKLFDNTPDQNLEKFVRNGLKLIITNDAAAHFSWYGRYENIAVEGYFIMEILKECALKKFPTCKSGDVISTIKKWFQYAKDRAKKSKSKNNAKE